MDDIIVPELQNVDTTLIIDPDTRTIDAGSDFLLGVETDNDAERVKFQCPKIVGDNLDLSQYHIYIHYQNAKGEKGKYLCEDIEDGGENITFSWLLSQKAVLYKGQTKFLVCAKKTQEDTIVWNTTLANGNVLEGLDVDEEIVQQNDDVIEQILLKLEQIEASGGSYTLPIATPTQLGGVKPIAKTDEMTQVVGIDELGRLFTREGVGIDEETLNQINKNTEDISKLSDSIANIGMGTPTTVSLVSEMTDTTKVYLYTGTEEGFTSGDWYYYDGSSWISGGKYGSTNESANVTSKFLNGLKYYALGDSIVEIQGTSLAPRTFGDSNYSTDLQNRDISEIEVLGYVQAIENKYGLVCTNNGHSGHTLVSDYSELMSLSYTDVAFVTIAYGVNDARTGVTLGTVNDSDGTTFAGALNNVLRKIYTDNPECRVIVLTPIQRLYVSEFGIATPNVNGNYLVDFVDMCKKVANKRSTKCIDLYRDSGINQTNLYYYTVEGVHPVNQGFKRMASAIIPITDELFSLEFEPFGTMTNVGDTEPNEPETDGSDEDTDIPTEDVEPTVVDISGLFINDGQDVDGWGTGSNTEFTYAKYTDIVPSKTYTILTYTVSDTTDYRLMSWNILNDDGSIKTGNYMTNINSCASGYTAVSDGTEIIDDIEYQRVKITFTTNESITDGIIYNISCLDKCLSKFSMSYI